MNYIIGVNGKTYRVHVETKNAAQTTPVVGTADKVSVNSPTSGNIFEGAPTMQQCHQCGAALSDNAKFCGSCGANLEQTEKTPAAIQELSFYKGKMLGTVTYKRTTTLIKVLSNQIDIQQTIKKIFCREKNTELTFPLNSVKSARVCTALDFWDTLYAIIFAVLGLFQPTLFLMAALCFWCGYGKEVEIALSNGGNFKIPVAGSKTEIEALLSICNNK